MANKKCRQDLNNLLPNGLRGNFSVKKITNTGRDIDCHVQGSDHLVELELKNHSPNPFAVKFKVEIQNGNIEFSNGDSNQHGETEIILPALHRANHWDCRMPIEANASRFSVDDIILRLEYWRIAMPGTPSVQESIKVDVN
jgi:hypothetical protein